MKNVKKTITTLLLSIFLIGSVNAAVNKEGVQLGCIAQEIKEVLPDVVKLESTGAYSVNPDNLTWYLINAVQELSAEVEKLKNGNNNST